MLESVYQTKLIKRLREMFPDCFILKNDSGYITGIPDLTVFYGSRWFMLEVKRSVGAPEQPNQRWYLEKFNEMSFAAFISPETEEEVLRAVQSALQPEGQPRVPKPKPVSLDSVQRRKTSGTTDLSRGRSSRSRVTQTRP